MTERCAVCIVGAGVSGLNALFVASQYLFSDQRVVLVDRHPRVGGMWLDAYDYVRLHQPHPFFTAGNIRWTIDKAREHLATKDEVLGHLHHCAETIKRRIPVTELFGYEFENCEEAGATVRITCGSDEGRRMEIEADRLIKAYGQGVQVNAPLELSSGRARSVSPDFFDVRNPEMQASDAPVWIVDVVDRDSDTVAAMRSGATMRFKPGSWVINCTGSLMRGKHPYEPYTSSSGRVLSIQNRSSTMPFPPGGAAGYFFTYLLFLDQLARIPLYALDVENLRRKAPQYVMVAALASLQLYNLSLIAEALPAGRFRKIISRNGLDFDAWFPFPRRLRASAGFMFNHRRDRKHHRQTLDTLAKRFGIRCEPVVGAGRA